MSFFITRLRNLSRILTDEYRDTQPNINEIYDSIEDRGFMCVTISRPFECLTNMMFASHIFLQLCTGGDLFTYISTANTRNRRLCEAEAKYLMFQLLKGLEYLHRKLVAHRGVCFRALGDILTTNGHHHR